MASAFSAMPMPAKVPARSLTWNARAVPVAHAPPRRPRSRAPAKPQAEAR